MWKKSQKSSVYAPRLEPRVSAGIPSRGDALRLRQKSDDSAGIPGACVERFGLLSFLLECRNLGLVWVCAS